MFLALLLVPLAVAAAAAPDVEPSMNQADMKALMLRMLAGPKFVKREFPCSFDCTLAGFKSREWLKCIEHTLAPERRKLCNITPRDRSTKEHLDKYDPCSYDCSFYGTSEEDVKDCRTWKKNHERTHFCDLRAKGELPPRRISHEASWLQARSRKWGGQLRALERDLKSGARFRKKAVDTRFHFMVDKYDAWISDDFNWDAYLETVLCVMLISIIVLIIITLPSIAGIPCCFKRDTVLPQNCFSRPKNSCV